jgi:hypothetical protein
MLAEVTELFERLLSELPPGTATLHVYRVPRIGGTVFKLKPTNPAAAGFRVHSDDFDVYGFSFGVRSQWEFPYERRYRKGEKDILTEIDEMCRAVIEGRCEERRGWFSLKGTLSVGDYMYEVTNLPMLPVPPFWTCHYAPYLKT